ncbi:chromosome partitioning protein ParA [Limosilactobacillus reuteri]|uniref:chromosome partitioning protein ParA n=1 Tax=Limosilactobacillus reuteri TaxID=1598 RepID=UPI001E54C1B3|nr:chromosome partitioning protein ParA [Limosilactobacillus reuteri]MCC4486293.1 chromosome partitioning protein ParA [Limosilactobacillus reuteri]
MAKTSKNQIPIKILTTSNSNSISKDDVLLIKANKLDTQDLTGIASKVDAKFHALVEYADISDVLNLLQDLADQGFNEGSYIFIDIEDLSNIKDIRSIYSNLRQGGYFVGLVNTAKGYANLKKDELNNIEFYKMVDQEGNSSVMIGDADGYINGMNIDLTGKLSQRQESRSERNTYTNVDISTDNPGWVGMGHDTTLGGGIGFGYSTMGHDFNTVISPKGIIFRQPDAERMWELLKPKQQAQINESLNHTVADEIKNQLPGLEKARQQADEAVKFAESAIAASKANSDAIVAQSSAVIEAKSAMDSATAEIQQLKANAASDVAQIEATIAEVQAGVNQAKSANESAVQAIQAEIKSTSDAMDKVKKQLDEVGTSLDTYAKSAAEQGHDITVIKQKQGQFEADFASAQGNVNQVQADIKGLRQNVKDNQGNIATLLTSADKLQASMTDAQKNISNLLLTASKYEQTFKDQDGRLSKVEQTATEHTSELADTKGNLDKVTQKANTLQLLLSDAQKNIQNIQLDAKGLHDTLTGQGNQLASLNVTLSNLDSKYSGITGDLQSKQTALSTEQQQTKDMLLNKADKSEVDNVKGTVNQVSAEQKAMADQINQKVSSVEYQTLKDKVNGMNVGGRNLLKGTRDFNSKYWYQNGDHTALADNPADPSTKEIHSWLDWHSFRNNQTIQLDPSKDYMISADIAIYGGDGNGLYVTPYGMIDGHDTNLISADINLAGFPRQANGEGFRRIYLRMTQKGHALTNFRIEGHGNWNAGSGSVFISKIALYEGNTKQGWEDSSDDLIENIQKNATAIDETSKLISLMAKQTEVDNVKNTAQQISARLDILAGEVKSKVDETRVNNIVDGKGYATTSTVQSLVDQKAGTLNESITNLTNKLVNNNGGGVNLVSGTIEDIVVDDTANTGTQGWRFNTIPINADLKVGDKITVSVENVTMTGRGDLSKWGATLYSKDISEARANNYEVNAGKNAQVTITVTSMNDPNKQTALLIYSGRVGDTEGKKAVFHHLKVERGEIATPYSQAPSDNATVTQLQSVTASIDGLQSSVTNYQNDTSSKYTQLSSLMQSKVGTADFEQLKRSVDMQTLDSADINNMRTNGHYFVRNLANNPVGGWVYVDVTGNGNDRIRQDVYQDSGLKHKYRRWFGTYWTGWEEGATYTEITQLQDAVNLRVQKGELLSQINLTAGNTLIQSNKLYLDASSVVITGTAFIPSAAIASLNADKVNTGWLNTNNVNLGDGRTRIRADHDYMYIQPTGSAASNTGIRMGYSGLDFLTNVIPNGYSSSVPYYSVGYDGAANGYFKISAFDHINPGGATATQNWFSMVDAISLTNREVNFAAKGNLHMQVVDGGVNIKPTLFFQNNTNNGTYAGFTRLDNSDTVEFNTGNNNGENFHVNSGARFMKYVYFNDYCRAQGWLTYSTLSKKTNIKKLDTSLALDKIRQDDQYLYEYKRNVAKGVYDPQASFIIDDVNDVSHYSVPREFIDQTGKYREPSVELSYLIAAFQEIDKQVQLQKEEIKELKEKLQHE